MLSTICAWAQGHGGKRKGEAFGGQVELFSLSVGKIHNGVVDLDFNFNMPIDPSSVNVKNISINSKACQSDGKIQFSKDGSMFRIQVKVTSVPFSVRIEGVRDFEGESSMHTVFIDDVEDESTYSYRRSSNEWQKF